MASFGFVALLLATVQPAPDEPQRRSVVFGCRQPSSLSLMRVSPASTGPQAAGVRISPTAIAVAEAGAADSYEVVLTSAPINPVTVTQTTDGETTVSPVFLVFAVSNWDQPQVVTVTAVDDQRAEGPHNSQISHAARSKDRRYDGIDIAAVNASVQDNDIAGIRVEPTELTISEPDGTGVFSLALKSEPRLTVTLPLTTSGGGCRLTLTRTLLFDTNWAPGVAVTVTAVDDSLHDGDQVCLIETGAALSGDLVYHGRDPVDVTVLVQDDDTPGFVLRPSSMTISELNGSAQFTAALTSEPRAVVSTTLAPSGHECTVEPSGARWDKTNWQGGVQFTVTAVDDDSMDGDQTCVVELLPVTSDDSDYQGLDPADLIVTVKDDEVACLVSIPLIVRNWPPVPSKPGFPSIQNADGNGAYTVQWDASERAESYLLQEATDTAFAGAQQVYEGPLTHFEVTGKGAARYFYRVKARNAWGDSSWSRTRDVDVLWEAEPNDLPGQANGPLMPGLTYFGAFPVSGDIYDSFRIGLSAPGSVEVWLRSIPVGQDYDLLLRDAQLYLIGDSLQPGSSDEHVAISPLPSGVYLIQVYHRSLGVSGQPYQLQVVY